MRRTAQAVAVAVALGCAAALADARPFAASNTAAAHRIPLPPGARSLRFSAFEGTLEVLGGDGRPLRGRVGGLYATPCQPAGSKAELVLSCRTGMIEAALSDVRGRRYLDIAELRGLPNLPGEEGPPQVSYATVALLGSACPGEGAAARGECAFVAGDLERAARELVQAQGELRTHRFAHLRLGDIALRHGDADEALAEYHQAAGDGVWGRVANARICELTGSCFWQPRLDSFDAVGLPEPLHTEMRLRELRALVILRRWGPASLLHNTLSLEGECGPEVLLCRKALLAALRAQDAPRELALEAYLRLKGRLHGHLAAPLAFAAAEAAAELGAPTFGATLLASTVREVTPSALGRHLRRAIELYTSSGDQVRARVMADYGRQRAPRLAWEVPAPASAPRVEWIGPLAESEHAEAWLAVANSTLQRARQLGPPRAGRR